MNFPLFSGPRCVLWSAISFLVAGAACAGPLNPLDYASLGAFEVSSGSYTIDTDLLTIVDDASPGIVLFTGVIDDQGGAADSYGPGAAVTTVGANGIPHIAVFTFDSVSIQGSATVSVTGRRALALLSHGDLVLDRTLDVSGRRPDAGPGGFSGGVADAVSAQDGSGPGGGGAISNPQVQAGPAGFGSDGVPDTGLFDSGEAGLSYGDLSGVLQGGSGGGGVSVPGFPEFGSAEGGGGGGAIELGATGFVDLRSNAVIRSDGEQGGIGPLVYAGQGGGGGVRIRGRDVRLDGLISAAGTRGDGGSSASGAGRVFIEGLGTYVVGGPFDAVSLVANVAVPTDQSGHDGVITVAPSLTVIPAGETLELAVQTVQVGGIDVPTVELRPGRLVVQGEATVPAGGVTLEWDLRLAGLFSRITGADPLTVEATLSGTGEVTVPVTISAEGNLSLVNDTLTVPGDGNGSTDDGVVNLGTINVINSVINGDVRSPAGTTVNVADTATFNGLFKGAASFSGTSNLISFNGGYSPGDSPAVVTFGGSLGFGSDNTVTMELGGPDAGGGYDQLNVAGSLALGGTLEVVLLAPFQPLAGQRFTLFDSAAITGSFDTVNLPALGNGLTWNTGRLASEGVIEVVGTTTFATEHPGLLVGDDDNNNSRTNFGDYALGESPTASGPFAASPLIDDNFNLVLRQRNNATDVLAAWEKRADLGSGDWLPLVQGIDYVLDQQIRAGDQDTFILDLLIDPGTDPRQFFRQRFEAAP